MAITFIRGVTLPLIFPCAIFVSTSVNAAVSHLHNGNQDQGTATIARETDPESTNAPRFTEYRGVRLGMNAEDARQKLGKSKGNDKTQDLFVFSDSESAQVFYDEQQKVFAISIDFKGKGNSPAPIDILGQDITAKADGSMYRMQQYADRGYWVSYNRTAGESPIITVTMQRVAVKKQ
ncbi:MAG TPA: hypothetical protein VFD63_04170 [Pyrinomonadaceae bacterium]|jgi:hypothetical protein|nr:hypothetical protein [Pyrinomonadaceae bacterium]